MEIWKPVLGMEELYEASDQGRFKRIARGRKLTAEKAELAKKLLMEGGTLKGVAAIVGVSYGTTFQIRSGKTWNGDARSRLVAPVEGTDFYLYLFMSENGAVSRQAAHRVVWEAFNGPIAYPLQINHKNLDRQDNRLCNLELTTHAENIQHAMAMYKKEGKCHNDGGRYYQKKLQRKFNKASKVVQKKYYNEDCA